MADVLTNAKIFFGGYEFSSKFNQVALEYGAESLDATKFGDSSRVQQGGLKTSRVTGGGFWEAGVGLVDEVMFDSIGLADAVVIVFPDAITEGATSTGAGFMFKVTEARYTLGGAVGVLTPFTFEAEGRGAGA